MKRLFIVSVARGYGGAERSIKTIARHLPDDIETTIYAAHREHIARLAAVALTRPNLRIRKLSAQPDPNSRRLAALSLLIDFKRHAPQAVITNTHASALLCGMVAKYAPQLGERTALFIRGFLWDDLDYILSRLSRSRILVPNGAVAERTGYLFPFISGRTGAGSPRRRTWWTSPHTSRRAMTGPSSISRP